MKNPEHSSRLQHTATLCIKLQRTATRCDTLQDTTRHCSTLHTTATHCNSHTRFNCREIEYIRVDSNKLQQNTTNGNKLQQTAKQLQVPNQSQLWRNRENSSQRPLEPHHPRAQAENGRSEDWCRRFGSYHVHACASLWADQKSQTLAWLVFAIIHSVASWLLWMFTCCDGCCCGFDSEVLFLCVCTWVFVFVFLKFILKIFPGVT